jgi:all-trans-8'-apo-beta-carotenal 15,15'-oxygenase
MTVAQPPQTRYTREDWQQGYLSQEQEEAYWVEQMDGTIPAELEGTLFRNGPGRLDVKGQPFGHPFDGDGMIVSLAFRDGRAFFRNRFVRTEGFEAESQASRILYRGVFGTQKPGGPLANCFDTRLKNIANTNVLYWGDRLLALWEAAEPHRLDPQTLATLGLDNLNGLLQPGDPFSAHPRIDPGSAHSHGQRRLVNFSVKTGLSSRINLFEFAEDGSLVSQQARILPGFAFLHDFALSPNYAIFFQNPVRFNPLPFLFGLRGAGQCLKFDPQQPTRILLVPRDPQQPIKTFTTEPCFVFHHANAFEQSEMLVVDSICYDFLPNLEPGEDFRQIDFDAVPAGSLWRFRLNLQTGQMDRQCLESRCCEFPSLNPTKVGQDARYVWFGIADQATGNAPLQGVEKLDLHTGQRLTWSAAPRGFGGEPLFVPRPGATQEDDGWILLLSYNAARHAADLVILSGETLEPAATLQLKRHIPYGLHGSFTPQYFGLDN